jgi:hypothetical protein
MVTNPLLQDELAPHKPVPKFLCVKAVLFFSFWQSVVVGGLVKFEVIHDAGEWTAENVASGLQVGSWLAGWVTRRLGQCHLSLSRCLTATMPLTPLTPLMPPLLLLTPPHPPARSIACRCFRWPLPCTSYLHCLPQNLLICFEMFLAALAHRYAFPAKPFEGGGGNLKQGLLRDHFALGSAVQDFNQVMPGRTVLPSGFTPGDATHYTRDQEMVRVGDGEFEVILHDGVEELQFDEAEYNQL